MEQTIEQEVVKSIKKDIDFSIDYHSKKLLEAIINHEVHKGLTPKLKSLKNILIKS